MHDVFAESQFRSFRQNLYLEYHRESQPLYNRTVYRNFVNETSATRFSSYCYSDNGLSNHTTALSWMKDFFHIDLFLLI